MYILWHTHQWVHPMMYILWYTYQWVHPMMYIIVAYTHRSEHELCCTFYIYILSFQRWSHSCARSARRTPPSGRARGSSHRTRRWRTTSWRSTASRCHRPAPRDPSATSVSWTAGSSAASSWPTTSSTWKTSIPGTHICASSTMAGLSRRAEQRNNSSRTSTSNIGFNSMQTSPKSWRTQVSESSVDNHPHHNHN